MNTINRWARTALGVCALALALVGCDAQKMVDLEVGVTTEAEVRAKWGEPAVVYVDPDGTRTLEYPRQPAGRVNYMLAIGPDGKLVALRQVLKPANFAKIEPGWEQAQVRRLLGTPAKVQEWPLKQTQTWDWRYSDGNENKLFTVTFDADGRVVSTGTSADEVEAGHRG